MNGKELFSKIILSLNSYLGFNDQDVIDLIDTDENLEDGISWLLSLNPPAPFDSFVTSLDKIRENNIDNFLSVPYSNTGNVHTINFDQPKFDNKNRRFAFSNQEFGFVSTKVLFDNGALIDLASDNNGIIWKQLEEYLERNYSAISTANINSFFDIIRNTDLEKGIVINKTTEPFNEDIHYPYIYLSYLNESNSIVLPQNLKYTPSSLNTSLAYDNTKNYEQYFDIYDVLNELNQAPDILNRFLRLYHTMEYFVYRVYLVNLVSRVGTSKLFVREFITSAENMKKSERESFKKNFKIIFSNNLTPQIEPALTPIVNQDVIDFLKEKNIVQGFVTNDIGKISELIYGLRCCIVHNKESEYHMTISNSEEYEKIIPLIRKILELFEELVIEKILQNHAAINYSQKTVNIY
ncbi:MAG: hypothetical protein NXI00_19005 [Cytophagales bacterium]|nr:hypothetical protein [Cytophagales bacterium]